MTFSIDAASTSGCTVNASTGLVSFLGPAGTCVLDANQAGDTTYAAAATAQQTVTVSKDAQTITFTSTAPSSPKVGDTYLVTATASSQLLVAIAIDASSASICSISSGNVTFLQAGTCVVDANQAGDASFLAAPQSQQSLTISKVPQTITFTSTPPKSAKIGGTYAVTATSTSHLVVAITIDTSSTSICSISSGKVTFHKAGTCVVDANQAGNSTYLAAPQVRQSFTVSKDAQTIAFTSTPPSSPKVGGTYLVTATSTSHLVVAITIDTSSTSICSISSGKVTFLKAGTCVIDANQAGNSTFLAAPRAQQSVTVKNPQTIAFTSTPPSSPKIGNTYLVTATSTSHLVVAITIDTSSTSICSISSGKVTFLKAGTCVIDANQAGNSTFFAAPQVRQTITVA